MTYTEAPKLELLRVATCTVVNIRSKGCFSPIIHQFSLHIRE